MNSSRRVILELLALGVFCLQFTLAGAVWADARSDIQAFYAHRPDIPSKISAWSGNSDPVWILKEWVKITTERGADYERACQILAELDQEGSQKHSPAEPAGEGTGTPGGNPGNGGNQDGFDDPENGGGGTPPGNGGGPVPGTEGGRPAGWDSRLDRLGIGLERASVGAGQACWRLVEARWEDEAQAQGRHHIYIELKDESGNRVMGEKAEISWADGSTVLAPENKPAGEYPINFPMYALLGSYAAKALGLPSDRVTGMGLGSIEQKGFKIHTCFCLTFQRSKGESGEGNPSFGGGSTTPGQESPPSETPGDSADFPPPSTPSTGNVQFGMNVNPHAAWSSPHESDTFKGIAWVRMVFIISRMHGDLEGSFRKFDPIVKAYAQLGVRSLFVINQETFWGNGPWDNGNWQEYSRGFAEVAGKIAAHFAPYGNRVAYELWNEEDVSSNSAIGVEPANFSILLKAAAEAVKRGSPNSPVVLGGLCDGPDASLAYCRKLKAACGGKIPVDAIGIHPYRGYGTKEPIPNWNGSPLSYHADIFGKEFPGIPLWITEVGFAPPQAVSDEECRWAAEWMLDIYRYLAAGGYRRIPVFIWFAWSDNMVNAGIIDREGKPKKSMYDAFMKIRNGKVR